MEGHSSILLILLHTNPLVSFRWRYLVRWGIFRGPPTLYFSFGSSPNISVCSERKLSILSTTINKFSWTVCLSKLEIASRSSTLKVSCQLNQNLLDVLTISDTPLHYIARQCQLNLQETKQIVENAFHLFANWNTVLGCHTPFTCCKSDLNSRSELLVYYRQ